LLLDNSKEDFPVLLRGTVTVIWLELPLYLAR
jgi:hypothetical protein